MMKTAANLNFRALAKQAANNHAKFDCFAWFGAPDDSELWTVVYTSNRDSCALDVANAKVIAAELEQFGDDVRAESHNHWACGYIDGYSIRVYTGGKRRRITPAFKRWCELQAAMEDYPVLDDQVLSEVEQAEIDESWEAWIRYEFTRELERLWEVELSADDSELRELFDNACSESGNYPEHSGREVLCNVERIAEQVSEDSFKQLVPAIGIKLFCDGAFLCGGQLHLDDYACDMPLYRDEFLAAMSARDLELLSIVVDRHG